MIENEKLEIVDIEGRIYFEKAMFPNILTQKENEDGKSKKSESYEEKKGLSQP